MNNTKPTIWITVGLAGSGKSTWAKENKDKLNAVIHSSDEIRAELLGDMTDQSKNDEVFKILHNRVKDDLRHGKNVVLDSTNLSRKKRVAFLRELKNIPCEKTCVLFATPFVMCCARNFARDRQVPEDVMVRMIKSFTTPTVYEGFNDVQIVWADYQYIPGFEYDIYKDMTTWKTLDQHSPHHCLSIGNHMLEACNWIKDRTNDVRLITAALLHDIGKPDTKSWVDSKGEPCEVAHYYSHESVGCYKALFYLRNMHPNWSDKDLLYVSLLINLHMKPYMSYKQSEKAKEKDRQLFGDDLIASLELLHRADLAAH